MIKPVQYPKAGQQNSAVRIGVVSAGGGSTVWLEPVGDPRSDYIPFMEWAGNSEEIVLQHINRKQNRIEAHACRCEDGTRADRADRGERNVARPAHRGFPLAERRQRVHLDERARGLAPGLRLFSGRQIEEAGHARRSGRDQHRRRGREVRLALLLGLARERDAALPLSRPARRQRQGRACHTFGAAGLAYLQDLA